MKTRELDKLKNKLPEDYEIILWRQLNNCTLKNISRVLNGDLKNDKILDAAIRLAEEHQNELKSRLEKINSL